MLDPADDHFSNDPYPTYAALRSQGPLIRDQRWGLWFFTRHHDVRLILQDRRFGRDPRPFVPAAEIDPAAYERIYPTAYPLWTKYVRESFIDFAPPAHTRIRRLVQGAFTKKAADRYRPQLVRKAHQLLDAALERETFDAISDYAVPIPLTLIGELMGIPAADRLQLVTWSHAIVKLYDESCSADDGERAEMATGQFVEYLAELLRHRRRHASNDLISGLIAAEAEGDRLTEDEIIATAILVLNAGHEATVHAIGNGLLALHENPQQFRALREGIVDPTTAANELLRYDSPLHMFERWVLETHEWHGVNLSRGSKVGLLLGSANRDEEAFRRPNELDLTRRDNPHVAFGGGIHRCVGAPLALAELEVAFSAFADRVGTFHVLDRDRVPRTGSLIFRGATSLKLSVTER